MSARRPRQAARGLALAACLSTFACADPVLTVQNGMAEASMRKLTWTTEEGSHRIEDQDSLLPGESATPLEVTDEEGVLRFDLALDGKWVRLKTDTLDPWDESAFVIDADTPVTRVNVTASGASEEAEDEGDGAQ